MAKKEALRPGARGRPSWPAVAAPSAEEVYQAVPQPARDYPLFQGIIFVLVIGVLITSILADLSYGFLDPRIRQHEKASAR